MCYLSKYSQKRGVWTGAMKSLGRTLPTTVYFWLVMFRSIQLRAIWCQQVPDLSVMSLKMILSRLLPHLPGTTELTQWGFQTDTGNMDRMCSCVTLLFVGHKRNICNMLLGTLFVNSLELWHKQTVLNFNSSDAGDGIFEINTMPADALAPKVASASAGMVLAA